MVATVATVAYLGLEARAVEVQVQLSAGLPHFVMVGLPDKAVAESRERVRAALSAIGLALPPKRITVNLSPADLPKEGSHFDLPIALCLLAAIGAADAEALSHYVIVGELKLDGRIASSPGVLLAAIQASSEDKGLICPAEQGAEAAWAGNVEVIAAVAGELEGGRMTRRRPFRAPHHSASMPALVGGGLRVRPGEISLAHLGVLFLDELPEFQRTVLDSLRQPLETGNVSVARANTHVTFPARVQLVAAMNPCRCGHLGDPALACSRAPRCAADYQARVSGPLLDRIDLHVEVAGGSAADLTLPPPAEGSADVASRVSAARDVQTRRYNGHGVRTNAEADGELLDQVATPDEPGRKLLADAAAAMRLSARGFHRVLRVARTIADLAGAEQVGRIHVAEALSYRHQPPRN